MIDSRFPNPVDQLKSRFAVSPPRNFQRRHPNSEDSPLEYNPLNPELTDPGFLLKTAKVRLKSNSGVSF